MMKDPDLISDTRDVGQLVKERLKQQQFDIAYFKNKVKLLPCNNQIKELHTVLRDKTVARSDLKFYADRLIRLIVEEGLNELPHVENRIIAPTGCEYIGLKYTKEVCGVSIMRSGEAMEKGLRECCQGIRIGKILIQNTGDEDEQQQKSVVYAKFPHDIISRKILLLYPITTSGTTVNLAINVLKEHGVCLSNIILLTLFATPNGIRSVMGAHPDITIIASEIHPNSPNDFGQRYFGTE